ncbi:hypothetical protein [Bradyrhizobium sp.]|jgi:hypothetical protein|uniref:hypothetical protein n=1 Tax=Bradyrhizobium sp. TaxID=376 RepID=UPI0039197884
MKISWTALAAALVFASVQSGSALPLTEAIASQSPLVFQIKAKKSAASQKPASKQSDDMKGMKGDMKGMKQDDMKGMDHSKMKM